MSKLDRLLAEKETEEFLKEAITLCRKKLSKLPINEADKDDVVQVAIMKVHRAIDTYDSSKAMASTYFDKVINNGINSYLRYLKVHEPFTNSLRISEEYDEDSDGNTVSIPGDSTEYIARDIVIDFMQHSNLNEKEKQIFKLRCEGFEFKDIAEQLGCSKARISQIWKALIDKYRTNAI
jgi:RNA polymerase sporulation-specific sigma factor